MPVITARKESHNRVVMYGALIMDGRQFVRTYEKFYKETFLKYRKALIQYFSKVTRILDNALQYKIRIVRECPEEGLTQGSYDLPRHA